MAVPVMALTWSMRHKPTCSSRGRLSPPGKAHGEAAMGAGVMASPEIANMPAGNAGGDRDAQSAVSVPTTGLVQPLKRLQGRLPGLC